MLHGIAVSMKLINAIFLLFCSSTYGYGQTHLRGWHLSNFEKSGYHGINVEQAYDFLKEKQLKPSPVVIAILDDGIDTSHEDLRTVLWVNTKEIAANGIDDDKNGYVDDLHGWNFLGNAEGRNVGSNSSEWIRVYWRYK